MAFSFFSSRVNPIAVDIGTDTIKLLQIEPRDNQHRLIAAACEVIPDGIRAKPVERDSFVVEALRRMTAEHFKGKQAVTCLPASYMAVQHLRMAKMGAEELIKALPFESAGKLPFDSHRAVLRHTVSGEVYQNGEVRQEIILMAAPRDAVERHLGVLSRAKLEIVGIHVEPSALIECFTNLFRRKSDEHICTLFVDIGAGSTHVVIAHGRAMVFAKHIPIGGDLLNRKAGEALKRDVIAAKNIRIKISDWAQTALRPADAIGNAHHSEGIDEATAEKVKTALVDSIDTLVVDLQMCVRYYESIFPSRSIDRVIFVGGESRHIALCQDIAQRLDLPAILGDPLSRLVKDDSVKVGVDTGSPQPGWAIAVGLAMGIAAE